MKTPESLVHNPHHLTTEKNKKRSSPSSLSSSSRPCPSSSSSVHPSSFSSCHTEVPHSIPQVAERELNPSIHLPSSPSVLAREGRDVEREEEEERDLDQHDVHEEDGSPSSSISWQRRAFSPIERGSIRGSIFTLASSCLGAGVLATPYAMEECGLVIGLSLLCMHAFVSFFTTYILLASSKLFRTSTYSGLAHKAIPALGRNVVDLVIVLNGIGVSLSFLVFLGDFLPSSLESLGILDNALHHRSLLLCLSMMIIFPLSIQRRLSALRHFTFVPVCSLLFSLSCVIYRSCGLIQRQTHPIVFLNINWNFFKSFNVFLFAFMQHVNVCPIGRELQNPTDPRVYKVSFRAALLEFFLYAPTATIGYLSFRGSPTKQNFMMNYEKDDSLMHICTLLLSFSMILGVPLTIIPTVDSIFNLMRKNRLSSSSSFSYDTTTTTTSPPLTGGGDDLSHFTPYGHTSRASSSSCKRVCLHPSEESMAQREEGEERLRGGGGEGAGGQPSHASRYQGSDEERSLRSSCANSPPEKGGREEKKMKKNKKKDTRDGMTDMKTPLLKHTPDAVVQIVEYHGSGVLGRDRETSRGPSRRGGEEKEEKHGEGEGDLERGRRNRKEENGEDGAKQEGKGRCSSSHREEISPSREKKEDEGRDEEKKRRGEERKTLVSSSASCEGEDEANVKNDEMSCTSNRRRRRREEGDIETGQEREREGEEEERVEGRIGFVCRFFQDHEKNRRVALVAACLLPVLLVALVTDKAADVVGLLGGFFSTLLMCFLPSFVYYRGIGRLYHSPLTRVTVFSFLLAVTLIGISSSVIIILQSFHICCEVRRGSSPSSGVLLSGSSDDRI